MPPKKKKEPWEPWGKSSAKQTLKKWIREGVIPVDYPENGGPRAVWDQHCENHQLFGRAGMKYDQNFSRRLNDVRKDHLSKLERAALDQASFDDFRANHPVKEFNIRGEPRWEGSAAQKQLKDDVSNQHHWGKTPKELYEDPNRQVYRDHFGEDGEGLRHFRNHIYQEERLIKFQNLTLQEKAKSGHLDDENY